MVSSNKPTAAASARRKSMKDSKIVTLKLSPSNLKRFEVTVPVKEESSPKDSSTGNVKVEPTPPSSVGDTPAVPGSTPSATNGTLVSSLMPPPTEGVKKKGVKRSAAVALGPDGLPIPKVRGKPGPKKKARLEDGSIDHSTTAPRAPNGTANKLGPRANQGAINEKLRALDRTGTPCRKWQKSSVTLKSFTGAVWEIPRWTAPPRARVINTSEGSASGDSSKENKNSSQQPSEKSNNDIEMGTGTPLSQLASSPAPSVNLAAPAVDTPGSAAPTSPAVPPASSHVIAASA